MADEPNIILGDYPKGILSRRIKTLSYPQDALVKGENATLAEGGIVTRPGSSLVHNATQLTGTIRAQKQVVFPTNEITYQVAQVAGVDPIVWEADLDGPARYRHSLVYDEENNRDILFGGSDLETTDYYDEVWARNRTTGAWTQLSPTGGPPPGRYGHTAHYRAADGHMYVIYGRGSAGPLNDVWKLDVSVPGSEAWTEVTTSGTAPSARYHHASCLIGTGTVMMCGGHEAGAGSTISFTTYYDLNLTTGAFTEVVGTYEGSPNTRSGHTLVYDGTEFAYVVGGNVNDEFWTNTAYKLNRTTHAWVAIANLPAAITTGLAYHNSLYCSGFVICVVGSGCIVTETNAQYQVFNCALGTWASVTPDGDIAPRSKAAMATDSTGLTVLHGGEVIDPELAVLATTFVATDLCTTAAGTGIVATYGIHASATHLPTTAAVFEAIYNLTADSGVIEVETLGDRAIITEGISDVPLVIPPGLLSTDPVTSWAQPLRVLFTKDGRNFHDVSNAVLDNDLDSTADIGGITTRGFLVIVTDVPTVRGFYLEFAVPNNATGTTSEFSDETVLDAVDLISREDIGAGIARWVQDSAGTTGHFEGASKLLDGAAVDNSANLAGTVSLPCVGHGGTAGDTFEIYNTVAYNGTEVLPAQTGGDANHLIITAPYIAEVFAGDDEVRQRFTLGTGNDAPLVELGVQLVFSDATSTVAVITNNGEEDDEVEISIAHATGDCILAGIVVNDADVVTLSSLSDAPTVLTTYTPGSRFVPQSDITQVIKAADLGANSAFVKVRLQQGITTSNDTGNLSITGVTIAERSAGSTPVGTPTPLTFQNGSAAVDLPPRYAAWVTGTVYAVDQRRTQDDINYRCAMAHTAGVFATDLAADKWEEIEDAYVDSDLILFTIDNTKDYLLKYTGAWSAGSTVLGGLTSPSFAMTTRQYGDVHIYYADSPISGNEATYYGTIGVVKIWGISGSLSPVTNLHVATTNNDSQLDTTSIDAFKEIAVTETTPGTSEVLLAISIDQRNSWLIFDGAAIRTIAKLVAGSPSTWWYIDAVDAWHDTGKTDCYEALRLAFAIAENQMIGADMATFTETNWEGIVGYPTLDFAMGLQADGDNIPTVTSFTIKVIDAGASDTKGWDGSDWNAGVGWTDNTDVAGTPFAQNGTIVYDNAAGFTGEYGTVAGVPGFLWKLNMRGTSAGTTLTKVRYQAPCQPLQNIGSGQPEQVLGFHVYKADTGSVADGSIPVSDETYTETASVLVDVTTADAIYVGGLSRFNEIEIIPYTKNNRISSTLTVSYWNGLEWTALTVVDGTSLDGCTFRTRGKVTFALPSDWLQNIPLDGMVHYKDGDGRPEFGYWLKFTVSATLTTDAMISEVKLYTIPSALVKYRHLACFGNRVALGNRPDAPDQLSASQAFLEYVWTGPFAANYRLGSGAITFMIAAWNTLLIGQPDRMVWLPQITGQDSDMVSVESPRHVPINRQCIVRAPMAGSDDGSRAGLFFLNRYGAYALGGIQADPTQGTGRFQVISDTVNWWDAKAVPRLDLSYLYLACGEYWPERNWIVWAVPMILDHGVDPDQAVIQSTTKVKIKATGHGRTAGDVLTFTGSGNYNGTVTLHADTDANYLVFTHDYVAETMTRMCRYSVAGATQTTNNVLIVYDLSIRAWLPWFTMPVASLCTAYEYHATAAGHLGSLEMLAGNYAGQVLKLFGTETQDNGTDISGYVETGWLNFGEPDSLIAVMKIWTYGKTAGTAYLTLGRRWFEGRDGTRATYEDYKTISLADLMNPTGEIAVAVSDPGKRANLFKLRVDFTGVTEIRAIQPIIPKDTDGGKYR